MSARIAYSLLVLFFISAAFSVASLLYTARTVGHLRSAVITQCQFDADIGGAPVVTQEGIRPSLLGVTIISDARTAWRGLGCPGALQPATPSFRQWAKFYHIPAN